MKKLSLVVSVIVLTASAFIFVFAGNSSEQAAENKATQQDEQMEETKSCCPTDEKEMSYGKYTESSIYQVDSEWTNQFGEKVNIGDLKGKTQIFTMIFANCTYACPILANDIRRIEQSLSESELQNVEFTLVSIDPERDNPARLKKFADDQLLTSSRWQLLTGERSDIDDLAALTGFRYKKENDDSFSHSNIITVLNEEGEIIHQQTGLNQDISKTVEIIKNQFQKGV